MQSPDREERGGVFFLDFRGKAPQTVAGREENAGIFRPGWRGGLPKGGGVCSTAGRMSQPTELPPSATAGPLPENATPEEKDLYWFRHVYQGDGQPQLTVRAVLVGGALGALMSISNLYTTLKLGWSFGVAITACVLSFVIWKGVRAITGVSAMSLLENNCMQSTASAAGYSTGATVGTTFAALFLISHQHVSWKILVPFVFFSAALGVFLAIPLKRQMINHEQLPFPSGIAAAETLRSLYSEGVEAMRKAWALVIGLVLSALIGLIKSYEMIVGIFAEGGAMHRFLERLHWIAMPELLRLPQVPLARPGTTVSGVGFEPGVLMIGAGMIMGLRAALSMLLGSAILVFFVAPWLVGQDVAHAGDPDWAVSLPIKGKAPNEFVLPRGWGVWGGTALMVFASLTSLAFQWKTFVRAFRFGKKAGGADTAAMEAIEVPGRWLFLGLVPISLGLVWLLHSAFQINFALGLLSIAMSFVLGIVACRATGETDTTPIGAMGKVTQLVYAVLAPSNTTINLTSAGLTAASAGSAADLLTDLKSGYLLGANPRRQFIAQFAGVFFGTAAVPVAWYLLVPNIEALEKFPLPAANAWKAMADLLANGVQSLPQSARIAVLIGSLLGIGLPVLEKLLPKFRDWIPSAMALGLGFIVDFANSFSFAIGALIAWIWARANARQAEAYNVPIASGFIAGESMAMALVAIASAAVGLAHKA